MLAEINKVDPKKFVEIGDGFVKKAKTIQLRRSETFLTDLMENICKFQFSNENAIKIIKNAHFFFSREMLIGDKLDDYAKARYKSNGLLTILKLTTPGGGMNPDMSLVDFIQDGDLNKSLKHFVSTLCVAYC